MVAVHHPELAVAAAHQGNGFAAQIVESLDGRLLAEILLS